MKILLIYAAAKVVLAGVSWLGLSSTRKNIAEHIEMLRIKPTFRKRPRTAELTIRYKTVKIIPFAMLLPGIGELALIAITLGRFSNKVKIEMVYEGASERMENDNLMDALDMLDGSQLSEYKTLRRETGHLSVQGHSEIARQSVITLNNLLIDASIAGIKLKTEPSIGVAIHDTAELVSSLLKEEQSGIQSNIDTYLNVIESIKSDLIGKKAVFTETFPTGSIDKKNS